VALTAQPQGSQPEPETAFAFRIAEK